MAVTIGSALLKRMLADRTGLSQEEAEKALGALEEIIKGLLATGSKVRLIDGYLTVIDKKATRRAHPQNPDEVIEIPAGRKIVFREVRQRQLAPKLAVKK